MGEPGLRIRSLASEYYPLPVSHVSKNVYRADFSEGLMPVKIVIAIQGGRANHSQLNHKEPCF